MIDTNVMQDASEIVRYDQMGIPLYIQRDKLSDYPDWKALCHWHEDLEFIRILFHPQLFTGNKLIFQKYIAPIMENQGMEYIYFDGSSSDGRDTSALLDHIYFLKVQAAVAYEIEVIGIMLALWKRLCERCEAIFPENVGQGGSDLSVQKDMVSFVHQHYGEKLSLSDIAASGSICRSKCCIIFKRYLQQSPIDFLNSYRLEVSRVLLKDTADSITQVAIACGFNHLSYYSKLFLRSYGCTPSQYRNLHLH
jgi:AraC-like DNA-binding protein